MAEVALGLALGAGRIVAALVSPTGSVQGRLATELSEGSPHYVLETAVELAEQLRGDGDEEIAAVGAAVPGHIDHTTGTVIYGYNLASQGEPWRNESLAERLQKAFGVPAAIDNDVNCMALYQQELGLGHGASSFVVIYLAPDMAGLGSGIVVDGKVVRGSSGGAGEFGHFVVQPGGPRCPCGNRGCLEAVIGVDTIKRNVNWGQRDDAADGLAGASRLAESGDMRAVETFRQAGRSFGQALSILANLLNPPLIIVGGPEEMVGPVPIEGTGRSRKRQHPLRSARLFREGYEETLAEYSFAKLEQDVQIQIDHLDLEMAAVGAAILGVRDNPPGASRTQAATRSPAPVS